MKKHFRGYFLPSDEEKEQLWKDAIFVFDTNVLLNLYRYSKETQEALKEAIKALDGRVFIPYQAAREFFKNRLGIVEEQSEKYVKIINDIKEIQTTLANTRHPSLPQEELTKFQEYSKGLIDSLEKQRDGLTPNFPKDEILDFVGETFAGKTGEPFPNDELNKIAEEGEGRYNRKIPPGYEDKNKKDDSDPYRKYGDLFIWREILRYSKDNEKDIIFISDDKKDDWWLKSSEKIISPRPELIAELNDSSGKKFWMYTVDNFIKHSNDTKTPVSENIIDEIKTVSESLRESEKVYAKDNEIAQSVDVENLNEVVSLLNSACDKYKDEKGWTYVSWAGLYIKKVMPDFDSRNYGFRKLWELIANFDSLYEMKEQGTASVAYRRKA